jgi:6-phosphogluconolactonase/glucosamine-6-phosphate isomerase/deaminase
MQLEFVTISSPEPAAKHLAGLISAQLLDHRRVLWLVSGGSAVAVAVAAARLLEGQELSGLTVSLIDERYGEAGHPDSNWTALEAAGFSLPGASLHPVLFGAPQLETAEALTAFLQVNFAAADYCVGLLGIGPDGHTAGILPHSPAVTAPGLVCAYDGGGFQRITITAAALSHLNEAVVYAAGNSKWPVLDRLETELPIADQPAQLLKTIAKLTIFADRPAK